MSAWQNVTSQVILSFSLVLAGAGCAAQAAEDPADEQVTNEKADEPVAQTEQASSWCWGGNGYGGDGYGSNGDGSNGYNGYGGYGGNSYGDYGHGYGGNSYGGNGWSW